MSEHEVERDLGPGATGDPDNPGDPTTPVAPSPEATEELRGQELDEALAEAGLPRSGTADEKRQRLAEHQGEPERPAEQQPYPNDETEEGI